jgi:ribosome-interacting GTPase 1
MFGCSFQLLDLPGIIEGAKDGKGRGRQVIFQVPKVSWRKICLEINLIARKNFPFAWIKLSYLIYMGIYGLNWVIA